MRDDRDRERDLETSRRDDDLRREHEDRERDDSFRRDPPPFRPDSRNSTGGQPTPITSRSASVTSVPIANLDRFTRSTRDTRELLQEPRSRHPGSNIDPRYSGLERDSDRAEVHIKRPEDHRYEPRTASPPPQAPPVPAFGSIPHRAPIATQKTISKPEAPQLSSPLLHPSRLSLLVPSRETPSAPKAHLLNNAPTAPKAQQGSERWHSNENLEPSKRLPDHDGNKLPIQRPSLPMSANSSAREATAEQTRNFSKRFSQSRSDPDKYENRPPFQTGPASSDPMQPSVKKAVEEQGRNGNIPAAASPSSSLRLSLGDPSNQGSPIKIPTGPRAERAAPSIRQPASTSIHAAPPNRGPPMMQRGGRGGAWSWVNPALPKHTPRGPSIMNTVPTKRDFVGEEKSRAGPLNVDSTESAIASWRRANVPTGAPQARNSSEKPRNVDEESLLDLKRNEATGERIKAEEADPGDAKPRTMATNDEKEDEESDEPGAEDGEMDYDEKDFAQAEKKFDHEMQALKAKRPPTPRSHPVILDLLEELDALASALEEKARAGSTDGEPPLQHMPLGLPSPKADEPDDADFKRELRSPSPPVNMRPQTPPLESLPFLISGPPTPFSGIEDLQDDSLRQKAIESLLVNDLTRERELVRSEEESSREVFSRMYKLWRSNIDEYEEERRAEDAIGVAPAPDSVPLVAPAPPVVGRRAKIISELDMEEVLKASQETAAKEEQARREREAPIYIPPETFNPDREAVVPDMLSRYERQTMIFNDTNNLVERGKALDALAFIPKKDDFTLAEHETFLYNYLLNPKRFGTIAEAIQGRDFRDCVRHYYLTKLSAKYKDQEAAFMKTKRGKKHVASTRGQIRPRASNLMSSSFDGMMDYEASNVPLNEKGRPRRAAAPTFGDNVEVEPATPAATPARRNAAAAKDSSNGSLSSEKPTAKRTRTVPAKERVGRKSKAPLLAAAPGPSPPKGFPEALGSVDKEPTVGNEQRIEEMEGAQVLAGLTSGQSYMMPPVQKQPASTEGWSAAQAAPINLEPVQKHGQQITPDQLPSPQTKTGSQTTSSYWSVPEQHDFYNLLRYFGTNWQAIAGAMKTKTHTMVSNISSHTCTTVLINPM